MARTNRNGIRRQSLGHYEALRVIVSRAEFECDARSKGTYGEYVERRIRRYHRDKSHGHYEYCHDWYWKKLPRFVRTEDLKRQSRAIRLNITKAIHQGDYEVVIPAREYRARIEWSMWG
ncbi:hypothetical protein ACYPKM_04180 [Pseudomonas aeruginosa]